MSGPEPRIGDADREAAVSALGDHYAAGRLTKEELDERTDAAFAARSASQLWPLFADLPRPRAERAAVPPVASRRARSGHSGRWTGLPLLPVLLVVLGLTVLTHLPLFLLVAVCWLLIVRAGRHRVRGHSPSPWSHRRW